MKIHPALALLCLLALPARAEAVPVLDYLGTYVWTDDDPNFGGFSGFDLAADGATFVMVSDRGSLVTGTLIRNAQGLISGTTVAYRGPLVPERGARTGRKVGDSEGLALEDSGAFYVSFEGRARVVRYERPGEPGDLIEGPREFSGFPANEGLEALALDPDGTLYTMPEHAMLRGPFFPLYRYRQGIWDQPFKLPAVESFVPVGADVGPDGQLYVLERDFLGVRGFVSRLIRLDPAAGWVAQELMRTEPGTHDNLESISVWRDSAGTIRLTMISDDNFSFLQQTQLVEYRLVP